MLWSPDKLSLVSHSGVIDEIKAVVECTEGKEHNCVQAHSIAQIIPPWQEYLCLQMCLLCQMSTYDLATGSWIYKSRHLKSMWKGSCMYIIYQFIGQDGREQFLVG